MIGSREIHYLVLDIGIAGKPAIVDAVSVLIQSDEHIHRPLELGHFVEGNMTGGGGVVARIGPDAGLLPHVSNHHGAPRTGHRSPQMPVESGHFVEGYMTGGGGVVARIGPDARLLPHVAIHRDAPRTGHRCPSDFESGYIDRKSK